VQVDADFVADLELSVISELRTLTSHAFSVTAVAVTSDGQRAFSGSDDQTLNA
jgi:hypothetical protein